MDLRLTPDQRIFQSTTREFLDATLGGQHTSTPASNSEGFDRAWWSQATELGWTAMLVPEEFGGGTASGMPVSELALVAKEIGRTCAPGPFLTTNSVLAGLAPVASAHADTIAAIVSGQLIASWAVYEPERGWNAAYQTTASPTDDGGYVLTGAKDRVEYGDIADIFLVTAASPNGPVQALVTRDTPGVTVTPTWSLDITRPYARVDFDDVRVLPESVVNTGAEASDAIATQAQVAAVLACAEMCGAASAMFDVTVQWMTDRYTFGRPLSSYQALKHRMADNKTWLEASLATTGAAALALDSESEDRAEMVSIAKSYVGDKAPVMMQDFVQLHGGLGVTWEHDLHRYLRRVVCDRALFGTPEDHRQAITTTLERKAA